VGTEVSPSAVEHARELGFEIHVGRTDELDLNAGSFDVVSLVEVLEHLDDPDSVLADAARLVRPGGAIYLTTPNGKSLSARVLGSSWSLVAPPEHLQLFSVSGVEAALSRAGFVVRRVMTHGMNPYELKSGLTNSRERRGGQSRTTTSYRLNESLSGNRTGTVIKNAANVRLSATRLGDTIQVVAERPLEREW